MRMLARFSIVFALLGFFLLITSKSFAARGWLLRSLCEDQRLHCVSVRRGESWYSLFPDPERRDTVMRINRMNTRLWPGMVIAVPWNSGSINSMDYAPFPAYRVPTGRKMIIYSPALNAWAAYGPAGNMIRWGPASSGQNWCPDLGRVCHTPSGQFRIYEKRGAGCTSTKFPKPYGGAPMPYCMFFKGGFAMHGSRGGVPGYNASHGCIRMFIEDAEWLNLDFVEIGTQVIILPYPLRQYAQAGATEDDSDAADDENEDEGADIVAQSDSLTDVFRIE